METADPWSMAELSEDAVFALECEAHAHGWDRIVHMCREERQRRND